MADVTSTFAAKDVGFTSTVNRMQRSLAGFQSGIGTFAVKAAGLVTAFVGVQQSLAAFRNALEMSGRLNDLSKTTGEAAGNLATLERAFQNNGLAAEQVGVSLAKMSEFVVGLQQGIPGAQKAADAMGISMADLADKTPTERMKVLLDAIAAIRDPALRTATAVDVFGRSGRAIIPLATDFSGALGEARAELGSLVPILNENSASLDELGDKLENAVGNKLNELAVGFAAGITGANNFVTALSRIDAAGFGKQLGDSLRVAFDAPHETAKAIGYTLLTGIAEAGNLLDAAFRKAQDTYAAMFNNPGLYRGLENVLTGIFAKVGETFFATLADGLKSVIGIMDWNPLWKPFTDLAKGAITDLQQDITDAGIAASNTIEQGMTQIKAAYNAAEQSSSYIKRDTFDAAGYAQKAADSYLIAQEASATIRDNSAETAKNFGEGSAAIRSALEDIRGFDLKGEMGPDARPDWTKSNKPPPQSPGQRIANEEAAARALHAPRGGPRNAPPSEGMRAAMLRGESRGNRARQRGNELAEAGMFRSAVRAFDRADRTADRIAENQRVRDFYGSEFGAGNAGEAFGEFRDMFGGLNSKSMIEKGLEDAGLKYDPTRDEQANFDRLAREQSKSPEERAREERERREREEEEMRQKHAPPGGRPDTEQGIINQIHSLLQKHMPSIDEKLPQHALVPG